MGEKEELVRQLWRMLHPSAACRQCYAAERGHCTEFCLLQSEGGRFSYPTFLLSNITDALNCQLLPVEAWPKRLLAMMMACLDSRAT